MRFALLAALACSTLVVTTSSVAATSAPTGLHAFLIRADEPARDEFHRTPSFAWNPYPGAKGYQFQLSMSSTFRENAIFYNTNTLTTPVAAPALVLPWITGSPHSLYARVRATLSDGTVTPWTDEYGFDVVAPAAPTPLSLGSGDAGLVRWTRTEGATSYQVWFVDAPLKSSPYRIVSTHTNVVDERDFYTFHPAKKWIGTVRWRIRAVRSSEAGGPANKLPATTYGPWSATYSSSNADLASGPITPLHTLSDVVSDGGAKAGAHRLMPGFAWSGTQTITGETAELFRVYVFTDKQCLNQVYASPPVGSPSYAPRTRGSLALPTDSAGIALARSHYLDFGAGEPNEMFDGTPVAPAEYLPATTPTTTSPADQGPAGSGGPTTASPASPTAAISAGAPVDLWDTDTWPRGGYYWTVVGVKAAETTAASASVAPPGASRSSSIVPVSDTSQFSVGQSITIGVAPNSDTATISAVGNGLITLSSSLNQGHAVGEPIVSTAAGSIVYRDMELPQDVCKTRKPSWLAEAPNRFGISSEPPLLAAQEPFATGLSPKGRLVSAASVATFYGQPLISWAPILSAHRYQVQWSKKAYPFTAEKSIITPATSVVLPLSTGTWYYRIRGFDDNLPTDSQSLGWSDVEKLAVAAPTFRVSAAKGKTFKIVP